MQVKVHNDNIYPYQEEFRGKLISIPVGEYVEMDEDEAGYFLEKFTFPKKDSQGRPDPQFFKKLRIERPPKVKLDDDLVCHANGQKAATKEELAAVLGNFAHMLAGKDEAGEAEVLKKANASLKKENKQLKTRLQRIEEKLGLASEQEEHAESV